VEDYFLLYLFPKMKMTMKKIAMALMVAGICAAPSIASAKTAPYVRVAGGIGMMNDSDLSTAGDIENTLKYNTALALEGAFGVKMDMFRIEAAVGYQSNAVDKVFEPDGSLSDINNLDGVGNGVDGNLKMTTAIRSYMVNGYADFDINGGVTPYLMAGVGLANVDAKYQFEDGNDWIALSISQDVFAWQVGAGVGVKATDNITVDLSYRYFGTSDVTVAKNGNDESKFDVGSSRLSDYPAS
jgi:opacity protein-like surface antigen